MTTLILIGIAAILLFLLQTVLIKKTWNKGLSVTLSFDQAELSAGQSGSISEVVTNNKIIPVPILHVKFSCDRAIRFVQVEDSARTDRTYKNDIFSLMFYQRITRTLPFTCRQRGYYTLESADLAAYPLFLQEALPMSLPQFSELYVFPEPADAERLMPVFRRLTGEIIVRRRLIPDPFAFSGIRDYTLQDPLKTVNWKASARTGALKVNTFDGTSGGRVCLITNLEDDGVWKRTQLMEMTLSIACSLAGKCLENGIEIVWYANAGSKTRPYTVVSASGITQYADILRASSRIDLENGISPFRELVPRVNASTESLMDACCVLISPAHAAQAWETLSRLFQTFDSLDMIVPRFRDEEPAKPADGRLAVRLTDWEVERQYV